jgi:ubiquinone/menaquinone biosynthesis C-methylase UbiE
VTFDVAADAYDRFMGRYSQPLAPQLADFAGVESGMRALDVGCGPGALTTELVARLGAESVASADPSAPFANAARERHPGVEVVLAQAEDLPFADDAFDATLAQLVVPFMTDPLAGLAEMKRVTRAGGVVAACVWNHPGRSPLGQFWRAARQRDPSAHSEANQAGTREGHLAELFREVGIRDVEDSVLDVSVELASFDDYWQPVTLGVGPAGAYLADLDADAIADLRERCHASLGDGPLVVTAHAWTARGRV